MQVVIDAAPLLVRSIGVKSYLYYWIQHLKQVGGDAVRTYPQLKTSELLIHEHSTAGRLRTWASLGNLALANYTPLPIADWNAGAADIFHASNLMRRPPRRTRLTATIHDMTCWLMPDLHTSANVRAEHGFAGVLKRADAAIAVSQSTKDDAVRILGLPQEKITVIHSGVPDAFFTVRPETIVEVRKRYRLDRPFILFIGTIEPRKNIEVLLDAYDSLPVSTRSEFEMVIAGPIGWAAPATAARIAQKRYLGYVSEADIPALTAAAAVFAYPSLYEGFGFPVAQALAAGAAVVTSNVSSLPEIAGDAAIFVDPRSTLELRDALARLLSSPELRARLGALGRCHAAQQFRWERCARQSLQFFESVLG